MNPPFNTNEFNYLSFNSSTASNRCNVYYNPDMAIINPPSDVLDWECTYLVMSLLNNISVSPPLVHSLIIEESLVYNQI